MNIYTMNSYTVKEKEDTEKEIAKLIKNFEKMSDMEVLGINFIRRSMCDTDEQKFNTWSITLDCRGLRRTR